jgi:hypothetical protein
MSTRENSTQDWMRTLATHYERVRARYPTEASMVVFDIDGTVLDMRHRILYVLRSYDRAHGTRFFSRLRRSDIREHENHIGDLLERVIPDAPSRDRVLDWYSNTFWSQEAILEAHRPFRGVLEVIRWFQIQPDTFVGLNTGRPERLREQTLRTLNSLGARYKVAFPSQFLFMNSMGGNDVVADSKVEGLLHFRDLGFHVFAFVDNEPENLAAIESCQQFEDTLLLHADTIFESRRDRLPARAGSGVHYGLERLVSEPRLPGHVQFVWNGVNGVENLAEFVRSNVRWAEVDVRCDPATWEAVLQRDPLRDETQDSAPLLELGPVLECIGDGGRGIELDLKEGGVLVDSVLEMVARHRLEDDQLWFNAAVEALSEKGFRQIRAHRPGATLQCPVDFLAPLVSVAPNRARELLELFTSWGVNRFSIDWRGPARSELLQALEAWGYAVNIYGVADLESFLQAILLLPRSVTADFDFPQWGYGGLGSGATGARSRYPATK